MKILGIIALVMAGGSFGVAIAGLFSAARLEKIAREGYNRALRDMARLCTERGKVMFVGARLHHSEPEHYPPAGTVGEVVLISTDNQHLLIHWPEGTTSEDGMWWVAADEIAPAALIETEDE